MKNRITTFTMILLDKVKQTLKKTKPGFIFMISVFLGCETADDAGLNYELQTDANVRFEEFTLPATNIKIDSLRTDGENRILVGQYTDALTGTVIAESYVSVNYSGTTIPDGIVGADFIYDSIRFAFAVNDYAPAENPDALAFEMYQLQDTLTDLVYLSNKNEVLDDLITDFSEPLDTGVFNFELPKSFGQYFFNIAKTDETSFSPISWPSLALRPNSPANAMAQIDLSDDTTAFYLYVTDTTGILEIVDEDSSYRDTTYYAKFILSSSTHYVNLERDPSASAIGSLADRETRDLTDGTTLIDPLGGISTLISLDTLTRFFEENPNILFNNVELALAYEAGDRDTLENFYGFLSENGNFSGSGLANNLVGSVMLSNDLNAPATSVQNDEELQFSSATYFQLLYNNYYDATLQEELGITAPGLFMQDGADTYQSIDGLVLISTRDVTLQRTQFKTDGIKLRVYYTSID